MTHDDEFVPDFAAVRRTVFQNITVRVTVRDGMCTINPIVWPLPEYGTEPLWRRLGRNKTKHE